MCLLREDSIRLVPSEMTDGQGCGVAAEYVMKVIASDNRIEPLSGVQALCRMPEFNAIIYDGLSWDTKRII